MPTLLQIADVVFFVFHSALICFILVGWAWRRLRAIHLAVVLGTIASWGLLGFWHGFGYCPCTDWHWRLREHLRRDAMPRSYLKFLFDEATGLDAPEVWVNAAAVAVLALVTVISVVLNGNDLRRRRQARVEASQ